jgi:hypothetical protein
MSAEEQAAAVLGRRQFLRLKRWHGLASALRAAEVRLYAEQHQARARWHAAQVSP